MMAASMDLPSTSSSTIAASSIHGTGAQNFFSALRNGWSAVSGIALGPTFSNRWHASSLDKPLISPPSATAAMAGKALVPGGGIVVTINLTYWRRLTHVADCGDELTFHRA